MSLIPSDGLSLSVGNGGSPETFTALRGLTISRFEVNQQLIEQTAIRTSVWRDAGAIGSQQAIIECEAFATDEAAATRLRSLSLSSAAGQFRLALGGTKTAAMAAFVTGYRETITPGQIKQLSLRLESTGVVTLL